MNTNEMKMMIDLERLSNITKTADLIGVSQPALSKILKRIEEELGIVFFYRLARSLKPTEEGAIYLDKFKKIIALTEEAKREVEELRNNFLDTISVSAHPILGKFILPKIESSIDMNLKVKTRYHFMNSRDSIKDVLEGKLDMAIVADAKPYPDLVIKQLWREYIGLYSIDGKVRERVYYNSNMIFFNKFLNKISYREAKPIDDYNVLYALLKRTESMGLLPNPIAESENKLKLIAKFQPEISICLVYRADRKKTVSFKKMISVILQVVKK